MATEAAPHESRSVRFFESAEELRAWLEANHDGATELLIGFHKVSSGKGGITYRQALDEALCYGWIDGVRKNRDATSYTIRFTPRRPGSVWSKVNAERAEELRELGHMRAAGLKSLETAKAEGRYSYEEPVRRLDETCEQRFKENAPAWEFFQSQPPSYRKVASWWVMSAKREETRMRRLGILMGYSEERERLPMLTPPRRSKT